MSCIIACYIGIYNNKYTLLDWVEKTIKEQQLLFSNCYIQSLIKIRWYESTHQILIRSCFVNPVRTAIIIRINVCDVLIKLATKIECCFCIDEPIITRQL